MAINYRFILLIILSSLLLISCSSNEGKKSSSEQKSRYQMANDRYPDDAPDVSLVKNAQPKYEPYSRQGNRDYTVLGKNYQVLDSGKGFKEQGHASWYGSKFHGHLTSNGETYDMYTMSAAHKNLPLPSYVKVTNLENNKQIIVRVNDRGPFHHGRVIDLSYAAAYHLGMLARGTTKVALETVYIPSPEERAISDLNDADNHFIQVVASQDKLRINMLAKQLETKYAVTSRVSSTKGIHRLQLGPIRQIHLTNKLLDRLQADGYPQSFIVP
ncbi:septal ring lytic transglycosylase RlpA [Shewanella sp. Actino-trap-3]|uniref:septal ring lytic transglycosylase RlpA family protein n=1 Tax=Shewanella sp. Actino-trap-3 TaxID=2058331 RepID=UPI000C340F2F|nr:septal ring lytic transglycosylase RlpA family protein [Shewanella sp. Actino-trap-3]PKG80102.1 septal ring lytic transglycosylase RlpA [Shewanella sp. Actino-trap-3]